MSPSASSLRRSPINQISEIKSYLFLSGIAVIRHDPIKNLNISTIVNATTEESTPYVKGVEVVRIRVEDHPAANLGVHFHTIADKIKSVKENGGKVLVHCMAGVSRSVSLVLAFLIKYENMSLRQAYYHVKTIRCIINPNLGFWKQLVDFERRLRGVPSVELVPYRNSSLPIPDVYERELREEKERVEREQKEKEMKERLKKRPPPFSSVYVPPALSRPSPRILELCNSVPLYLSRPSKFTPSFSTLRVHSNSYRPL